MAEESARKRASVNEESSGTWKIVALKVATNSAKLLGAGILTGFGMSLGQGLHKKMSVARKSGDVIPLRKTI